MKTEKKNAVSLRSLAKSMGELAVMEAQMKNPEEKDLEKLDYDQDYLTAAKKARLGIFRLVVMGEVKKGKSSFINAIVGLKNLVPVLSDVATSTVFKIHYGKEVKYTVYFKKEKDSESVREPLVIDAGEVNAYGTEDGNKKNIKGVDYIRVQAPSPILKDGLILVDTPGVGGLLKEHREISYRQGPQADAVFFVTDGKTPIGKDEVAFIKELRQVTSRIYFVQTKASESDTKARKIIMDGNVKIILEHVGIPQDEINYFVVDSVGKLESDVNLDMEDLADSGFMPLMSFLNNTLRKDSARIVTDQAIRRSVSKMRPMQDTLAKKKRVCDLDSETKRKAMGLELETFQKKLLKWNQVTRPELLKIFNQQMQMLSVEATADMSPLKPGGVIQSQFKRAIDCCEDRDTVQMALSGLADDLPALASKKSLEVACKFQHAAESLCESLAEDVDLESNNQQGWALPQINIEQLWVNVEDVNDIAHKLDERGLIEKYKGPLVGGVVIGNVVAGAIFGPLGIVAGVYLGYEVLRIQEKHELGKMKHEANIAIKEAIGTAYSSVIDWIRKLVVEQKNEAESALGKLISGASDKLVSQREELTERKNATQQEIAKQRGEITVLAKHLARIQADFQKYQEQNQEGAAS